MKVGPFPASPQVRLVHCEFQARPHGLDWLDPHPKHLQGAAELCAACPAMQACRRYLRCASHAPRMWAGTTEADREQRAAEFRARPDNRKTATA